MISEQWARASYSQKGMDNCVECRSAPEPGVLMRDTRHRHLGHLEFPVAEWEGFLRPLKQREL
ncbi:DUF397 domain-containing protein [Nocardiopsis sp. RSe5-2]|uniref:DUF397 domain-containing protein n=1 Tax=Nocardiopsis endophytica TaxID=3018445 RepID=A0ABT4U590_9ACTN|nr:DUF397 domain-containing protein [Nocardiopsis endophytica]MDA2812111.1 DUF397 domain-containing protein [Nocardiopsis endophytica]